MQQTLSDAVGAFFSARASLGSALLGALLSEPLDDEPALGTKRDLDAVLGLVNICLQAAC